MPSNVRGCHLVGSVPLKDSEEVFRATLAGHPSRLKRIPDGETGSRHYFTLWQCSAFGAVPEMLSKFEYNVESVRNPFTQEEVDAGVERLKKAGIKTGYDDAAIESYAVFKRLKEQGVIAKEIKFQVCIPTNASVVSVFIEREFQPQVWPLYEDALIEAMRNIQDNIPHEELAIQLDLAADTAFWEGVYLTPWFEGKYNVREFVIKYLVRMVDSVDKDVDLGLHNCYGDMDHKHWLEPKSLRVVVDRALMLFERSSRSIQWHHAPVPVSAMDSLDEFLAPLKELVPKLQQHGTELYLGVVQYGDLEGTKKRIEAASKIVPEFGVASECGWGRTPVEQIDSIMDISSAVSEPWDG